MKRILLLVGLLLSMNAHADGLAKQVESFIQAQYAGNSNVTEVKVLLRTPESRWPPCELPQLSLSQNARRWGNITISARCGQERRLIQAQVQVEGRYLVAARGISAGSKLTADDIKLKTGRLDTLPARTLTDNAKAIGAVSLRNISPGQPLNPVMLRRAWVIKAGQQVQVMAQGNGFNISGVGKAMNNAAAEDSARVRMASGQIVSGIANDDGTIRITL
ncbi:flagellar basal body P-ring formation chaperone FlgA [Serratia silvae]|uniref:Flagella basal body P-ring formation protein FlgA n=1 Tax=Serratia silvae TaxID=2824122 RepID=A0ABT0K8U8_9GAMM|nr:flagellar basal body P-ring formation chaperone FlgA [Serratia silvae]MCL1028207.1 flagellar basal body P-ring formation protein FlgA [Serratia silvae]